MDKDKELAILKMVYDTTRFESVHQQESPDFSLQYTGNQSFGIEITELYFSESNARLNNLPWYTGHLLDGGKFIHKNDARTLQVDSISFIKADGTPGPSDVTAVIQKIPSSDTFAALLAAIIERKNNKIDAYSLGLSHVNLIVADMVKPFHITEPEEIYKYLFTPQLKQALVSTRFKEVFLVTQVKEERQVYIPLKMLLLVADLYLFDWAAAEYYPNLTYDSLDSRTYLFVEFLAKRAIGATIWSISDAIAIHFGGHIIMFNEEGGISIIDYLDLPIVGKILPIKESIHSKKLNAGFMDFYEDYVQRSTFSASIVFDVKGQ